MPNPTGDVFSRASSPCATADKPATASSQEQTASLRFRNRVAKLPRGVDPQTNRILRLAESAVLRATMCRASRMLRHFGHECPVLVTPIDDDCVFSHSLKPSLAFRMGARTCFAWYGFAFAPRGPAPPSHARTALPNRQR